MPNFDICGTVFKEFFKDIDVLNVNAKTKWPQVKIVGEKVQKMSNQKYCINMPFVMGFPNDAGA